MKKKQIFAISLLTACAAIAASGSLAYFNASETAHNVITSSSVDIRLEEWRENPDPTGDDWIPFVDVTGVVPGTEVSKIVTVRNTGDATAWIRVKTDLDITFADGITGTPDLSLIDLNYNNEDWTAKDGYWYYNTPVAPGGVTEPLFTTVAFDISMGNQYQNSTAEIDVSAQAVQTANNGTASTDAQGWPAD